MFLPFFFFFVPPKGGIFELVTLGWHIAVEEMWDRAGPLVLGYITIGAGSWERERGRVKSGQELIPGGA
jgi:hypothetical protein